MKLIFVGVDFDFIGFHSLIFNDSWRPFYQDSRVCGTLIQSHLDWDEKASEMCYGAQATDCWTFATTKENKIPCMIPMVEETEGCVEGLDSRLKFSKIFKNSKI